MRFGLVNSIVTIIIVIIRVVWVEFLGFKCVFIEIAIPKLGLISMYLYIINI